MHAESFGTHIEPFGAHAESLGMHDESFGTYIEPFGAHAESLGTHSAQTLTESEFRDQMVHSLYYLVHGGTGCAPATLDITQQYVEQRSLWLAR
jgi:hypothetical protein